MDPVRRKALIQLGVIILVLIGALSVVIWWCW